MPILIPEARWRARAKAHRERLSPWVEAHRRRRAEGEKHPVFDFLFTYYSYPPGRLLRWSPGAGFALANGARDFESTPKWRAEHGNALLDPARMTGREKATAGWIAALMRAVDDRPARFGCFGLHEWAMVYRLRPEQIRHESYPLRLGVDEVAKVVEAGSLCCSHFDAFRFFTRGARPLNSAQPTKEGRLEFEQGGCLHTNMDLYKWCYKLAPWIASELLADCFLLAAEIRELDMRASPYDLASLGVPPVRIETPDGRAEYEREQRRFAERAAPLRQRLAEQCKALSGGSDLRAGVRAFGT